jgi:hypothetical protein
MTRPRRADDSIRMRPAKAKLAKIVKPLILMAQRLAVKSLPVKTSQIDNAGIPNALGIADKKTSRAEALTNPASTGTGT